MKNINMVIEYFFKSREKNVFYHLINVPITLTEASLSLLFSVGLLQ